MIHMTNIPIGARVQVVDDRYGTYRGMTGTVVPEPPVMAKMRDVDLTGTVWVALDEPSPQEQAGYNPPPPPGFDPDELAIISEPMAEGV